MARWMVHIEQQIMTVQFRGLAWIKVRFSPVLEFLNLDRVIRQMAVRGWPNVF